MRCVTHPFKPSSMQPAATTNKSAAATAYIRGMQAALGKDLKFYHILGT